LAAGEGVDSVVASEVGGAALVKQGSHAIGHTRAAGVSASGGDSGLAAVGPKVLVVGASQDGVHAVVAVEVGAALEVVYQLKVAIASGAAGVSATSR
jgi:hypothetical protein